MKYDVIIIGSGPAGYVAAIRAGQVGLKTAIIEKESIGGMCLNWGCIPTKSLIESAKRLEQVRHAADFGIDGIDRKKLTFNWQKARKRSDRIVTRLTRGIEFLLKKNEIEIITGTAEMMSASSIKVDNRLLETDHIIIATGSRPAPLEFPNSDQIVRGIQDFLAMSDLPDHPVVYGCNPHAVELAQFFQLAGRDSVLLLPGSEPIPGTDSFLSEFAAKMLKKAKVNVITNADIIGFEKGEIHIKDEKIPCDSLINASDRLAVLPPSKVEMEKSGSFVHVNEYLQTSVPSIFAIGDVNGTSGFAHVASAQGLHAVNVISGIRKKFDVRGLPVNIYTYPEMAQLGMTEAELKQDRVEYKVSEFPLSANGKAMIEGQREGLIRLLSDKKYGEVLGVQIVADHATDMIAEAAVLVQLEGTIYDVANTIHAHPTVAEIFMESGFDAMDQPIHK